MPIFAREPATTVRQRSPWLLPKLAYAALFLAVAAAAYGWKYFSPRPPTVNAPAQATARLCIHQPDFAYQDAWREILGRAKTEVRDKLRVEAQRSGQQTVVAISLSSLPAERVVPMVNAVAAAYSQTCRAGWKLRLDQAHSAAEEKVRHAERQADEAQARFELLRDRRLRPLADMRPVAPPPPTTIENPRWTEIRHRLADMEEGRQKLLLERTPLHPSVREIEMRIADVRREMASIPPQITREPPADSSAAPAPPRRLAIDAPAAADVEAARQAAQQLKQDLRQAQGMERAALAARSAELQIDLVAAEPLPPPPAPPRFTPAIVGQALAAAATSIVGLAMISWGASLEPALASIAELQALLPAPIIGVLPATHPQRRRAASALRRRIARWSWITAGLAVLFAVAWLFFIPVA